MTAGEVVRRVGDVGRSIRVHSSLGLPDYADGHTLRTTVRATPEEWARAMLGDTPSAAERVIWRGLLGFPLVRRAGADVIAGWPVGDRGPDWIRMENASGSLAGNLIVVVGPAHVSLGTLLRYDRPRGRRVWAVLSPVHRWVSPRLLRDAEERLRRRQA